MAIRTITWTVDEDMHVSPTRVQNAGVQGDDNATRVVFSLPAFLQTGHKLYIEYVDGVSGYDKTDPLDVVDGAVHFDLPLKWTQHGGESTVRLVATKMIDDVETLVAHSKPECRIRFDGRAKAFAKIKSLIEGSIQAAQDRIAKMIADAKVWIDNVNGVYVGSGDMPDGCVIQIDPTGEALLLDNEMSDDSENVPKTKVVKKYVDARNNTVVRQYYDKFTEPLEFQLEPYRAYLVVVNGIAVGNIADTGVYVAIGCDNYNTFPDAKGKLLAIFEQTSFAVSLTNVQYSGTKLVIENPNGNYLNLNITKI